MNTTTLSILESGIKSQILQYYKNTTDKRHALIETLVFQKNIPQKAKSDISETLIPDILNQPAIRSYKNKLFTEIENIYDESDVLGEILDNEISYIQTMHPKINNIKKRSIQNEYDLFDCIKDYNILIDNTLSQLNQERDKGQSYRGKTIEIAEGNTDSRVHIDTDPLKSIIRDKILEDLKYHCAAYLINFLPNDLNNKKERAQQTLDYIESFVASEDNLQFHALKTDLTNITTQGYNPHIINQLLYPKHSYVDNKSSDKANYIVFNENKDIPIEEVEPEQDRLSLLSQRCSAIIEDNHRDEYILGQEILDECERNEINL